MPLQGSSAVCCSYIRRQTKIDVRPTQIVLLVLELSSLQHIILQQVLQQLVPGRRLPSSMDCRMTAVVMQL
jgi:hypothetical protein